MPKPSVNHSRDMPSAQPTMSLALLVQVGGIPGPPRARSIISHREEEKQMVAVRNLALSVALIAGLFLPIGAIHVQSTETVTATCKDGTSFSGTKRSGACRGHGGVQSWGTSATSPGAAPSQPAPVTSQRAAPCPGGAG